MKEKISFLFCGRNKNIRNIIKYKSFQIIHRQEWTNDKGLTFTDGWNEAVEVCNYFDK